MALIQVNAATSGLQGMAALQAALLRDRHLKSITLMTHGLRFHPGDPEHCPHTHILSFTPRACWKAVSWPKHLHLDRNPAVLGVGFGWPARGPLRRVAERAFDAGAALARVIQEIHRLRPDLQVNILAHSLGARVVLCAIGALPEGIVSRIILMSGAEYRSHAVAAMASPGGRGVQVLNMCSGENAPFDALFRLSVRAPNLGERALSAGLAHLPGWVDLRIDCPRHRSVLRGFGLRTRAPATRICHWSTYLRPGVFGLYRQVLDPTQPDLVPRLATALAQTEERKYPALRHWPVPRPGLLRP